MTESLDDLHKNLLEAANNLNIACLGLEPLESLALASLLVDMRVTQIVNGVRGVHAILPHGAIS